MERTTVYLPADLKAALERVAREQGRSEAEIIREGVRSAVGGTLTPRPQIPLFASGQPTLADDVDSAMAGFGQH